MIVDVTIIGSGFAGSILAWILSKSGLRVALVDAAQHPRFAIGESSTPIADMILRRLGDAHQIGELRSLSTWGSWQEQHPELACGRKRGFSYFQHQRGQPFGETTRGEKSLLVAASANDHVADTHWFRSDVDAFLHHHAIGAGAVDLANHRVVETSAESPGHHAVRCVGPDKSITLKSEWVIDASGAAGVLANLHNLRDRADELQTRTHCAYAHYRNVASWTQSLSRLSAGSACDPFDPDDAAQHHLIAGGWLWMLRFNNDVTSVGFTAPMTQPLQWSGHPSVDDLMQHATRVYPSEGPRVSGRLQRFYDPVIDSRRLMLPTAAVTLDPLHSTGIAHALAGVERIVEIITLAKPTEQPTLVQRYRESVIGETMLLDRLVSTAYATMGDFNRFTQACMLYFAGAIACEERYQRGETPHQLWNADDPKFVEMIRWACRILTGQGNDCWQAVADRLQPWNTAGLMDRSVENRYAYTATK